MKKTIAWAVFLLSVVWVGAHVVYAEEVASSTDPVVVETSTTTDATTTDATSTDPVSEATSTATTTEATSTTPVPNPVHITLDIESQTGTIFNNTLDVTACSEMEGSATTTVNALCALEQSGVPVTWSWWGDDAFLDTLGGVGNDYALGNYWLWFSDLEPGATSFNKHTLHDGEKLLVTIGRMPMKLAVSTTTPEVGATTTVTVSEFGFDSSWNSVWLPSASSTITWGDQSAVSDAEGHVEIVATTTDALVITGAKTGFLLPEPLTLNPVAATETSTSTATTTATTTPVTSGGGGGSAHTAFNIAQAYAYLSSVIGSDGSFGSDMVTDWAAIGLSDARTPGSLRERIRGYLTSHRPALSSVTDYERHAMALLAFGIDPQTAAGENYIKHITDAFDGTQVGDAGLVNDDIFALFPLAHTGYTMNDSIIQKTLQFIISQQGVDGSWDSVDVTAAGIQGLTLFSGAPGASDAIAKARAYLKASQRTDGGWQNPFSTSWAMQGVLALGESPTLWTQGSSIPEDALQSVQLSDGSVGGASDSAMTRTWATVYALPAVLGTPWHALMSTVAKIPPASSGGSPQSLVAQENASTTATTTDLVATTTQKIVESTESLPPLGNAAVKTPTPEPVKKPLAKKVPAKTTPSVQKENPANQLAQVPENKASNFVGALFHKIGHGISSFFSWVMR